VKPLKSDVRLDAILGVLDCESLCDIGADHGKLPALAVIRGAAKRAIAADISAPSLKKAEKLAAALGLSDKIETRLSDGFESIDFDEADVFVIAGMGGYNIISILGKKPPPRGKRLVLVPHRNAPELRAFLILNGYLITSDAAVLDGQRLYDIISAVAGSGAAQTGKIGADGGNIGEEELYLLFGKGNFDRKNDDFYIMLKKKAGEFDKILKTVYNIGCAKKKAAYDAALLLYRKRREYDDNGQNS
jgi:tRNA (adenine22-N1)-methyltransferase